MFRSILLTAATVATLLFSAAQTLIGVLLLGQSSAGHYEVTSAQLVSAIIALFGINGSLGYTIWCVLQRQVERADKRTEKAEERADRYEQLHRECEARCMELVKKGNHHE